MKKNRKSPWLVFSAIILAIVVGILSGPHLTLFGINLYSVYDLIGSLFLKALTLVIVPLVASSIISGVARIGNDESFKRLGTKTFAFYLSTSLIAILIGLFFVNLFHPGTFDTTVIEQMSSSEGSKLGELQDHISGGKSVQFTAILNQIIPSNIVQILSQGQMLGLIFFSLVFGYAISKIPEHSASVLKGFWQAMFETMIKFTQIIMKFLPLGVFCLVAKVFATTGIESFKSLALFSLSVILGLGAFMFVALPLMLKFIAKVDPFLHFRAMGPALITAFSTSSSSATLPITIECVEKRAGVSNKICSLVVPLGTSINMSGSALYECVAAIFVAQSYGLDLSFTTQFLIVLLALITSMGVAGIPSASLVAVIVILKAVGLPAEGIGLFVAVDRILDMCRTTVNVFSDSCCAILVACTEGEKKVLSKATMNYEEPL